MFQLRCGRRRRGVRRRAGRGAGERGGDGDGQGAGAVLCAGRGGVTGGAEVL